MVHSKKDEEKWEESTLEPIAIVGMSKLRKKLDLRKIKTDIDRLPPPRRS